MVRTVDMIATSALEVHSILQGFPNARTSSLLRFVGVDKVPTRAMEQILKQDGLKIDKVAILVGGPDWPTSAP